MTTELINARKHGVKVTATRRDYKRQYEIARKIYGKAGRPVLTEEQKIRAKALRELTKQDTCRREPCNTCKLLRISVKKKTGIIWILPN